MHPEIGRAVATDDAAKHERALRSCIRTAIRDGTGELHEILRRCEGADPVLVARLFAEIAGQPLSEPSVSVPAYEALSTLSRLLPAPDPSRSQWWFSSAGLTYMSSLIEARAGLFESPRIFCLGTPTLGPHLAHRNFKVDILDIDEQVLDALQPLDQNAARHTYDAADAIPPSLSNSCQIAVLDPPWYRPEIYTFVNRALECLVVEGEFFCTLPGRLTRPGVETLRIELVRDLAAAGHEVLALERGSIQYQVPRFELAALSRIDGFGGIPWRAADLLHVRKLSSKLLPPIILPKVPWRVFSRRPTEFRVFSHDTAKADTHVVARYLPAYSANVSTRSHPDEDPDIWSSEKIGLQVGESAPIIAALEAWADGKNQSATINQLIAQGYKNGHAEEVVGKLADTLSLWSKFAAEPPLRLDREIEKARLGSLSNWATQPSAREHHESPDPFRGDYQRDRDRILWSTGLRRLSNKTQLFPVEHDDDLRQRLTHTIEVFQLASTIGTSFGLDGVLVEAGALAHDIGHTPFGHLGEHALDTLLNLVNPELGGFNHYEHGVDVLRYLEGSYHVSPVSAFNGLNLTQEISECVLKHTFVHDGDRFSTQRLLARSKHSNWIKSGYCHLEGQAVRIADKISYLVSDIEDGIRLGALSKTDILSCSFFHRPPLDFTTQSGVALSQQFSGQRRWALKILMEDVLQASSRRLSRLSSRSDDSVRNAGEYMIQHSDEMISDLDEIWKNLQVARLHRDRRVISANLHAARIVTELTIAYSIIPDLMEHRFRQDHRRLSDTPYMNFYRTKVGQTVSYQPDLVRFFPIHLMIGTKHKWGLPIAISVDNLIMAKDYVVALSDSRARAFHNQLIGAGS